METNHGNWSTYNPWEDLAHLSFHKIRIHDIPLEILYFDHHLIYHSLHNFLFFQDIILCKFKISMYMIKANNYRNVL